VLIPAKLLLNEMTVVLAADCRQVTYYHVELDAHDVLLAEGTPAESYLDTGNRGIFENAGEPMILHPDLANDQGRRDAESCAPFVSNSERVEPVWRRIADRAVGLGHTPPGPVETTWDPGLGIMLGERHIAPVISQDGRCIFVLPAWSGALRLVSRCAAPADGRPWIDDRRRLGVAVSRITLTRGSDVSVIPVDHPMLGSGWWDLERDARSLWRWTDGDAQLDLPAGGLATLEVKLAGTMCYQIHADPIEVARAMTSQAA